FLVMEHRHVPVNVDDLASFFLHRDAVVNLGYAGGKYWQLSLRHSALVASSPRNCNPVFRLISFSWKGPIYRARSGGLKLYLGRHSAPQLDASILPLVRSDSEPWLQHRFPRPT